MTMSKDDANRLRMLIDTGVQTKMQVKDLNESLREVVTEVAADLDLPKALLNKAIAVAAKAEEAGSIDAATQDKQEELDAIIELLHATGKK